VWFSRNLRYSAITFSALREPRLPSFGALPIMARWPASKLVQQRCLYQACGDIPPAELEAAYYSRNTRLAEAG
jgi:hypothetical protein